MKNLFLLILTLIYFGTQCKITDNQTVIVKNKKEQKKESSSKNKQNQIKTANISSTGYTIQIPEGDFIVPFKVYYHFIVTKTLSKYLNYKILFIDSYFKTIFRNFISPQAP
ncbi:MAG: hypothetical protein U0V72_01620 [Cytophagales bacterium]